MLPFFVLAAIFASNAAYVLTPVFSEQPWPLWDMAFFIVLAALGFAALTLFG
jgi:hypothetical protein